MNRFPYHSNPLGMSRIHLANVYPRSRSVGSTRGGFFIQDLLVSIILLSVLLASVVPMFAFVTRSRRLAYQEQVAYQLAANWLDELLAANEGDRETLGELFAEPQSLAALEQVLAAEDAGIPAAMKQRLLEVSTMSSLLPEGRLQVLKDSPSLDAALSDAAVPKKDEFRTEGEVPRLTRWQVAIDWQVTPGSPETGHRHTPIRLSGWTLPKDRPVPKNKAVTENKAVPEEVQP
ncbi:MAG: hypothetical protein C0478_03035 [Planctomyces sp.]|nr:hypothetical protein [Planctomyces sp.]